MVVRWPLVFLIWGHWDPSDPASRPGACVRHRSAILSSRVGFTGHPDYRVPQGISHFSLSWPYHAAVTSSQIKPSVWSRALSRIEV